jgi:hypothetical protein
VILSPSFRTDFSVYLGEHFGDGMAPIVEPKLMPLKRKGVARYVLGLEAWMPSTRYGPATQVQCVDN